MPIPPPSVFDGHLPFWLRVVLLVLAFGWSIWAYPKVDVPVLRLLGRLGGGSWPRALLVGIGYPLLLGAVLLGGTVWVLSEPIDPLRATVVPLLLVVLVGPFVWAVIPSRSNGPHTMARELRRLVGTEAGPAWTLAISAIITGLLPAALMLGASVVVLGLG
ncbi:hypothetical protein [Naumannella halotolerans]|uniref:hypothetical protein n=1 Tax=Naumannella halotolerans TaxID=993414 RepID=UPI0010607E24|nr:hypothetical protein [Naumannella halotolerans]